MSYGKKWKMTRKQMGRNPHSRRWRYHVCGGRKGKISMRFAMSREIWYWD